MNTKTTDADLKRIPGFYWVEHQEGFQAEVAQWRVLHGQRCYWFLCGLDTGVRSSALYRIDERRLESRWQANSTSELMQNIVTTEQSRNSLERELETARRWPKGRTPMEESEIRALMESIAERYSQRQHKVSDHPFIGKYVICRCYGAGVHSGVLISVNGDTVILHNSRRLWKWVANAGIALSGVAIYGLSNESKLDTLLPEIALNGVSEIIPCSDASRASIDAIE